MPARAAIDQFERAASDIDAEPGKIRVWLPIIRQYGPAFLQECQNAIKLSEALATDWLSNYMFKEETNPQEPAAKIATWLANHNNFKTHSRPVWMAQLLAVEPSVKIRRLQDIDEKFEAAIMAVYWAIDGTFSETPAIKLIEHREGSAYIQLLHTAIVGPTIPPQSAPPTPSPAPQNRSERRRQKKNQAKKKRQR